MAFGLVDEKANKFKVEGYVLDGEFHPGQLQLWAYWEDDQFRDTYVF
ncbi:MAG: hypothetical protein HC780_29485 [Leptolyngbyaceae cyanobacterium CSU_1_3]|nr:hypothetical protein [Leptolyngbyaceae cyanobacterium CSU_1_3]